MAYSTSAPTYTKCNTNPIAVKMSGAKVGYSLAFYQIQMKSKIFHVEFP